MPRIPLPRPEAMSPAQRRVYDEVIAGPRGSFVGPLRAVIHWPELADHWQKLGALVRFRTDFPPRLSELAILATARAWDAQFEWHAHEPINVQLGPRPYYLVDNMDEGPLKQKLLSCTEEPMKPSQFSMLPNLVRRLTQHSSRSSRECSGFV